MEDIILYALAISFSAALSLGYALRGGQYITDDGKPKGSGPLAPLMYRLQMLVRGITHEGRWYYVLPMGLFTGVILQHFGYTLAAFTILHAGAVFMGHGIVYDLGRFLPKDGRAKSRAQGIITLILGREDYTRPFWKRYIHNFAGMMIMGFLRWGAPVWVFYGLVDTQWLIINSIAATFLYALSHEAGWQIEEYRVRKGKQQKLIGDVATFWGEHITGFVLPLTVFVCLIQGRF